MARKRFLSGLPYTVGQYLYIVRCGSYYKIGRTQRMGSRMTDYRVNNPYKVELVFFANCNNYRQLEKKIHEDFKEFRHKGEWFVLQRSHIEEIIEVIKSNG